MSSTPARAATGGIGARILKLWSRCSSLPGGRLVFGFLLGRMVPYSGTIKPEVVELEAGRAVVRVRDRRRVRNHLRSIHAIALANLGELTSGLAMTTALGPELRAIVTHLEIEYLKKARGTLTATGLGQPPSEVGEPVDVIVTADIKDSDGDDVARVRVTWRIGPR